MTEQTPLTPLGALLEAARKERGWSQNHAGKLAGLSGTTWRNVAYGKTGKGSDYPGTPASVAQMAMAVELDPDEVERAGRPDVAAVMRHRIRARGVDVAIGQTVIQVKQQPRGWATELAPGVRELKFPPELEGMFSSDYRYIEFSSPAYVYPVIIMWGKDLPDDLETWRDVVLAQGQLLSKRADAMEAEVSRPDDDRRDGTRG